MGSLAGLESRRIRPLRRRSPPAPNQASQPKGRQDSGGDEAGSAPQIAIFHITGTAGIDFGPSDDQVGGAASPLRQNPASGIDPGRESRVCRNQKWLTAFDGANHRASQMHIELG